MRPPKLACMDCGALHWRGKRCTRCAIKHSMDAYNSDKGKEYRSSESYKQYIANKSDMEYVMKNLESKLTMIETAAAQIRFLVKSYQELKLRKADRDMLNEEKE